ncbi:MAG: membrane protein insertion efficiency factor YidD [Abitibacteriaceae bacterium]|nr:membrane protein insertion efficiency factor YidD [Abditibacteriaceae bacterium]
MLQAVTSFISRIALTLIRFYQRYISPLTPPACRFYPTCSHYTYQAIERFGIWRGAWLGFCRICKCHPFHAGGCDPVPETLRGGTTVGHLANANNRVESTPTAETQI